MGPLKAWEKADPFYEMSTRGRNRKNRVDEEEPTPTLSSKPHTASLRPSEASKATGTGKGKSSASLLDRRMVRSGSGARGVAALSTTALSKSAKHSTHDQIHIFRDNTDQIFSISKHNQASTKEGGELADGTDGSRGSISLKRKADVIGLDIREDAEPSASQGTEKEDTSSDKESESSDNTNGSPSDSVEATLPDGTAPKPFDSSEKLQELQKANETIRIIAEVALKGTIMRSPYDFDSFPLFPVRNTNLGAEIPMTPTAEAIARIRNLFNDSGCLPADLATSATSRREHIRDVIMGTLIRKRNDLIVSINGYDLPTFLTLVEVLLPQIEGLSESGIPGDLVDEQACVDMAWQLILDIFELALEDPPINFLGIAEQILSNWNEDGFAALVSIDRLLRSMLGHKMSFIEPPFSYEERNWLRDAEIRLEELVVRLAAAGSGIVEELENFVLGTVRMRLEWELDNLMA